MNTIKKIFNLLTSHEKKQAFTLLILILFMALLDMLGVASILPFIAVLTNPQLIETNVILSALYQGSNMIGVNNQMQFLFLLGVLVFLLLIISLSVRAFTQYAQIRFSLMREYSIGKRLIESYLNQPYAWFLNRHSADLGKTILSEVSTIVNQTIVSMASLVAHSAVAIALLILLILTDPMLALSVGIALIISYVVIFILVKKILSRIGSERIKANEDRFIAITEAFGAAKEIKLGGLEHVYINRFTIPAQIYANSQSLALVLSHIPRFFIEGIAFGGMILLILLMMSDGSEFTNIIPIIALYAFAGYRLIPALQNIYYSLAQIRFSKAALDSLHNDLISLKFERVLENVEPMILKKSITFNNIHYNYPNNKHTALKNISFEISAFDKVGFVGSTGSGKTTTIDIILGLLDPSRGTLAVDGNVINNQNKRSWQKNIGYVPQQIYLSDNSISANIAFGVEAKNINHNAVKQAAKIANLHEFVMKELPNQYDTDIGERGVRLSGGQRQRIGIARALYKNPHVLILDEATSALDNVTELEVMKAVNNLKDKITTIIIAHRLSTVRNCDKIFLLDHGELKDQGNYDDLLLKNDKFKSMDNI